LLVKPTTLMNRSGQAVSDILNYFQVSPEEMLLVHDDLDIALGEYKIQFAKGPKIHNGIDSVENYLDTKDFWRLRLGIENRGEDSQISGKDFVLYRLEHEDEKLLIKAIDRAINTHFVIPSRPISKHPLS